MGSVLPINLNKNMAQWPAQAVPTLNLLHSSQIQISFLKLVYLVKGLGKKKLKT